MTPAELAAITARSRERLAAEKQAEHERLVSRATAEAAKRWPGVLCAAKQAAERGETKVSVQWNCRDDPAYEQALGDAFESLGKQHGFGCLLGDCWLWLDWQGVGDPAAKEPTS